jgi:hypothetical protein
MKRKDFKDVMSSMLADDPQIVAMIQNKTYTIGDMHMMLAVYNKEHPAQAGPPPAAPPTPKPVVKD